MSQNFDVDRFKSISELPADLKLSIKFLFIFNDRNEKPPHNNTGKNAIFVTDQDELYVFGGNTLGCLGLNNKKIIKERFLFRELSGKRFNKFYNGCHHVIAINANQEVFSWGYNNFGQLGRGTFGPVSLEPVKNDLLSQRNIVDISCGDWHTLALTGDGIVYAWGYNSSGQVGNISNDKIIVKPIKLEYFSGHKMIAISCGSTHSMALTEDHRVFSWGANNFGQLGRGNMKTSNEPKIIHLPNIQLKKISCGQNHSFLLSNDEYIYAFGESYLEGSQRSQDSPFKLISSVEFSDIASIISLSFSLALSKTNCYLFGKVGNKTYSSPERTEFKSFQDYFTDEYQITLTTINTKKDDMEQSTTIKVNPKVSNKNLTEKNISKNDDTRPDILPNQTAHRAESSKQSETNSSKEKANASLHNSKYTEDFQELDFIGKGGFSSVYKVLNKFEEQHYAIKKIDLKGLSKEQKDFALKELRTMAKLQNECVVQYKTSWIEDERTLFIQMELCLMTLQPVIEKKQTQFKRNSAEAMGPLECYFVCEIFKEIAECIDFLHKYNPPIMHRDIKPQNILISNGSNRRFVKLGDFGLAKFHTKEDETHTHSRGTKEYMAPEILRQNKYDTSADIYSFGVITQELFDIDFNSTKKLISENSISEDEYTTFSELIAEMMHAQKAKRPSSEKLIQKINSIEPTYEKLTKVSDFNGLIDQFEDIKTIDKNFYVFFLRMKLKSYMK